MSFRIPVTVSSRFVGSAVCSASAATGHRVQAASSKPNKIAPQDKAERVKLPDLESDIDREPLVIGMDIVVHPAAVYADSSDSAGRHSLEDRIER